MNIKQELSLGTSGRFAKLAWRALLGFSIVYAFVYNGRSTMGLVIPMMMEELHWSAAQAGFITSILFWVYAFGQLLNGRIGEIVGTKKMIMLGIIFSVLANWLISLFASAVMIAFLWGLNGYFQSMIWSPGINLLSKWWPRGKRGFAIGVANGFSGIAPVVAQFSVFASIYFFPEWKWRAAFRVPVAILLIMAFVFWLTVKEEPKQAGLPDYEEDNAEMRAQEEKYKQYSGEYGKLYPYKLLFKRLDFNIWCIIVALSSICRYGLLTWIPMYYIDQMGMTVQKGVFGSVVLPAGMAFGTFLVPWWTDRLFPNNPNSRLPAVIMCGALSALTVFIFPSMTTMLTAAFAIFWAGFFVYAIDGVVFTYAADIGGRVYSGTAAGILDCAAYLGAGLQAVIYGRIFEATGNWAYVFASIACLCVLMVGLAIFANSAGSYKAKHGVIRTMAK